MRDKSNMGGRVFGREDFRIWLDRMSRATLGVSGTEFISGYREGRFADRPVAHDLASVIPFAVCARSAPEGEASDEVTG